MADDKETKAIRKQIADGKEQKLMDKAYEDSKKPYVPEILKGVVRKASGGPIRGGGCETKGKTKGRMV
jgi:hypothetical protein